MSYKSIVTFVTDHVQEAHAVATAAALAEAEGGHLTVVCLGIDRTNPGAYYAGANAMAIQQTLAEAEAEATENAKAIEALLGVWSVSWDVVKITAQIGALSPVVGERAHLADLVVLPKPYGEGKGVETVVIAESALFRTRVPLLVVPPTQNGPMNVSRVIVAWNESPESLAAIRGAIPMLKPADGVDIAIIDPPAHAPDRSDPGGALAEMLSRHGVRGDVSVLAKTMPRISDVLLRHCEDKEADLLVMGAYGHSRFREAILGGATRNMLEMATIPVLMAH